MIGKIKLVILRALEKTPIKKLYKNGTLELILDQIDMGEITTRAAEISFFTTLAIFPVLLFMISVIGFIPEFKLLSILNYFESFIPEVAYGLLKSIIESIVAQRSIWLIIVSLVAASWAYNKAIKALIKGMNSAYGVKETRGFFKVFLLSILFILVLIILIVFTLVLVVYGRKIEFFFLDLLKLSKDLVVLLDFGRFSLCIALAVIGFNLIYKLSPNIKLKYRYTFPGALITTISWIVISFIYAYYTNNMPEKINVYGPITETIVLLTWIYFGSFAIIFGYKFNAVRYFKRENKTKN